MLQIDVPLFDDKELQHRFEKWLTERGNKFSKKRSKAVQHMTVHLKDEQDAFWIGCNYVSLAHKLFDGPLTRTLS